MANNNLEQIGVETVVEGMNVFIKNMNTYSDKLKDGVKDTQNFQKETEKTKKSGNVFTRSIKSMGKGIKGFVGSMAASIPLLGGFGAAITAALGPVGLAIAGVAALGAGIVSLGRRGGEVEAIRIAFGNMITPILGADESLDDFVSNLKSAADGTIAEVDLLRAANTALAGTSGELKETFGRALPDLLSIAGVQAAATGQSTDFLFESLVVGIKRASPLLIDNTGLTLSLTDAYASFAEQAGKSVDQLTDQEKQIALINATVEAGLQAIADAGGVQITAATELERTQAILRDSTDELAVAFEPLAAIILRVVNIGLQWVQGLVNKVAPVIRFFGDQLLNVFEAIQFAQTVFSLGGQESAKKFSDSWAVQLGQKVIPIIDAVRNKFTQFGEFIINAGKGFAQGAANIAAAIGNGLLAGANTFVFPAVIEIATFIANFLSGFSPPKMGPLSTIDKGAANIMEAWTGGFVGGFKPQAIEDVAGQVNGILGNVANFGIEQVESRLAMLDEQLRPFSEQLKIVKDRFEALQAPAEAGIRAIDRQLEKATQALARGDKQAEETVRQLNLQREALTQNLDAEQARVDAAEVQLAFARSRQAEERTLLEIQKARLGGTLKEDEAEKKIAKTRAKSAKAAAKASGAGAGAGAAEQAAGAGAGGGGLSEADNAAIQDFATGESVNPFAGLLDFGAGLGEDFLSGLNAGGELDEFQANTSLLDEQLGRIGESDPVQGILGAFEGFGDELKDLAEEAIGGFTGFFTDPDQEGGFAHLIKRLNEEGVSAVVGDMGEAITSWVQTSIFDPINEQFGTFFNAEAAADSITFYSPFKVITTLLPNAVGNLLPVVTSIFSPIKNWVEGSTEDGGLPSIIDTLKDKFAELPRKIFDALFGIGAVFYSVIIDPFVKIADEFIGLVNEFLRKTSDNDLIRTLAREIFGTEIPEGGLTLETIGENFSVSQFSPTFPEVGQATGGVVNGPAMVNVGERGQEQIALGSGQVMSTFNNQFVRAMNTLSNSLLSGSGGVGAMQPVSSSVTNNNNRNLTINASTQNGMSAIDILNEIALARVF